MRNRLLTALASLRVRLIVTYVLVTAISFGFLVVLLIKPVGEFILHREVVDLAALGITLGSTVRVPGETRAGDNGTVFTEADFLEDQQLMLERTRKYLGANPDINVRVRMLDNKGAILTDSMYMGTWDTWVLRRKNLPDLHVRYEVQIAQRGTVDYTEDYEAKRSHAAPAGIIPGLLSAPTDERLFVAVPITRGEDPVTGLQRVVFIMYLDKPVADINGNMAELQHSMMIGMVISLLVTMLVSVLISSNLSAGLHSATQVAQAFARGNMTARMSDTGPDEVGMLGTAFNRMADALQRQEQSRRDLLADVSHELRTPLTAISACAESLTDGMMREDPEAAEHFLGIMIREAERLQRLVNDILELSKLQARAVKMPLEPVAILPIIEDAVEVVGMHARQEGITLEFIPPVADVEGLTVLGNGDRLAQALRNLLDNARHHSPAGKMVRVTLDADAEAVHIHVSDEGEGIPAADLPWVFDRFYRAGKGAKPGGTGLGLAIVREIIEAHSGQVSVESTVGQGTTFTLHLPRASVLHTKSLNMTNG